MVRVVAKQSFKFYTPRDKPKKRGPRAHKNSQNKSEKRQKKQLRYKGQGWQTSSDILYLGYERKTINTNKW